MFVILCHDSCLKSSTSDRIGVDLLPFCSTATDDKNGGLEPKLFKLNFNLIKIGFGK